MTGLSREMELERLVAGRCADSPDGLDRFEVDAVTAESAAHVLERAREVLRVVLESSRDSWPSDEEWARVLPAWFVERSADERAEEEAGAWETHLDALPEDERAAERDTDAWSVGEFVHWFQPEEREWWWWGADVLDPQRIRVCLAVQEPTPFHAALDWLLRAAGAVEVVDENLRDLRQGRFR